MWIFFAILSAVFAALTLILDFTFLHEEFTVKSAIGSVLITLGTVLMVL